MTPDTWTAEDSYVKGVGFLAFDQYGIPPETLPGALEEGKYYRVLAKGKKDRLIIVRGDTCMTAPIYGDTEKPWCKVNDVQFARYASSFDF